MKIESVTASIHEFPIYVPLIDDPITTRKLVVCKVAADTGVEGWGITGSGAAVSSPPSSTSTTTPTGISRS